MGGAKGKLLKGAAWLGGARVFVNLTAFVSTIFLARLLTPEDFGLVAIVTAIAAMMAAITELSLSQALIHREHLDEDDFRTAWTLNLMRGCLLACVLLGLSLPISWLYGDERLVLLLVVLAGVTLVGSLENPKLVTFQRNLVFKQDFIMNVGDKIAAFVVAIAIAVYFRSYWALIIGAAAAQVVRVVLSYFLIRFRPGFSFAGWRCLMSFSIWLTLGKAVQTINQRSVPLLIGLFLPTTAVGQYSVGDRVATLPVRETVGALQQALFPAFARMRNDMARLRKAYLTAQGIIAIFAIPMGAGMAILAEPMVRVILEPKWLPAVPVIQAIALCAGIMSIQNVRPLAMATGIPKAILGRDLRAFAIQVPLLLLGLIIGRATQIGALEGVAIALGLSYLANTLLNLTLVKKITHIPYAGQLAIAARPCLAAVVMVGGILIARVALVHQSLVPATLLGLVVQVAAGALSYIIVLVGLWLFAGKTGVAENELLQILKSFLKNLV